MTANGNDIIGNNSKIEVCDSEDIHYNGVAFEFSRGVGGPITYTGTGLTSSIKGFTIVGCNFTGSEADFPLTTETQYSGRISGSTVYGNITIDNRTQITGSHIKGNISTGVSSGADTLVVGNHVTGTISGSVEINQHNTS